MRDDIKICFQLPMFFHLSKTTLFVKKSIEFHQLDESGPIIPHSVVQHDILVHNPYLFIEDKFIIPLCYRQPVHEQTSPQLVVQHDNLVHNLYLFTEDS